MKAVCWYGVEDVRVEDVPEPRILNSHDAVIRVTLTAICGSDLHLYGGFIPGMREGDILGHEFMGEVVAVGREVRGLKPGDRVVSGFNICCGGCFFCKGGLFSLCDNSNPNAAIAERLWGATTSGLFGYSHLTGGYAGGQAQFVRIPFADSTTMKLPGGLPDEQVLFLSDILPTGYQAAEQCEIKPGDVIAVWGCGPVGQMAIRSCFHLGAERVIAIDDVPERLKMAEDGGAQIIDIAEGSEYDRLMDMTGGRGPDACIDAVGMEAHGRTFDAVYDRVKTATFTSGVRAHALREAIWSCRKGGIVSVPGVYAGPGDKIPLDAAFQKGLRFRGGQTHTQRYMRPLFDLITAGTFDPSFVITHHLAMDHAPDAYRMFQRKQDGCIKVVMDPWADEEDRFARAGATVGQTAED